MKKKKNDKGNLLPFLGTLKTDLKATDIVEEGSVGGLKFILYGRGNIHFISGSNKWVFKKDADMFEDAMDDLDIDNLVDGQSRIIKGAGDTDHLVITKKDGSVEFSLKKRAIPAIEKLMSLIERGKDLKKGRKA